ncbi:MAG: hypothetical protein IT258_00605 [Saprospiraceae bacterium]|nr:hypothetical protein [Saprospiraceae bacterium]
MKYLQLIIGILIIGIVSCERIKPNKIDYCKMLTKDQSHVNHVDTDTSVMNENNRIRQQIFLENYVQLIQSTKEEGFPNISEDNLPQDSCKYWAVTATLIHMAQAKPEIFFSEETISLFKKEMDAGHLKSEDLVPAFRISFTTNEFCDSLQETINKALQTWKMEPFLNSQPKFKKCN